MKILSMTEEFSEFASRLCLQDIPPDIIASVKMRVLDTIGLIYAANERGLSESFISCLPEFNDRGPCTVIGATSRYSAAAACLINGSLAHGLDYDDTHVPGQAHPSSVIVPVALALSEQQSSSGKEFLTAATLGYELMTRIGGFVPAGFIHNGFHTTSIAGTFGAATVASKLRGSSTESMVNALGIAGSQTSGLLQALKESTTIKRAHPGWAAMSGQFAATLASDGVTGPKRVLDGNDGLFATHLRGEHPEYETFLSGLGTTWSARNIAIKPYPCCQLTHSFIDCALEARLELVEVDEIERISLLVPPGAASVVCQPWEDKVSPPSEYAARFSLPFTVAAAYLDGGVYIDTFDADRLDRPELQVLISRMEYELDHDTNYPNVQPGRLIIALKGGGTYEFRVEDSKGTPSNPMTFKEVADKFRRCMAFSRVQDQVSDIIEAVQSLEDCEDIREMSSLLPVRSTP